MSLYSSELYGSLVGKLVSDDVKWKRMDRFEWMEYLLERYDKLVGRFMGEISELCDQYERNHRKSPAIVQFQTSRIAQLMKNLKTCSTTKQQEEEGVGPKEEYLELCRAYDMILRFSSVDWHDWSSLVTLFEVYLNRALVHYEQGHQESAISDLRHASSVLIYCQCPEEIHQYFVLEENQAPLIKMVALQMQLLKNLGHPPGEIIRGVFNDYRLKDIPLEKEYWFDSEEEVEHALDMAQSMDSIFEAYEQTILVNKEVESSGAGGALPNNSENYHLSKKIRLGYFPTGGRTFVSTEHINYGEEILMERCLAGVEFGEHLHEQCNYCHRSVVTFWPCSQCSEVVYCSSRCSMLAFAEYHQAECGLYGLLLGEDNYYSLVHSFRWYVNFGLELTLKCEESQEAANQGEAPHFDMNEYLECDSLRTKPFRKLKSEEREVVCRALTSLWSNRGKRAPLREHSHSVLAFALAQCMIHRGVIPAEVKTDRVQFGRLLEYLATLMLRICTNGFCWSSELVRKLDGVKSIVKVASCVCYVGSMFNHSCMPNVNWNITSGGVNRFTALRVIKPGEMLTLCYGPQWYQKFSDRQDRLVLDYCFYCRCEACLKDAADMQEPSPAFRCQAPGGGGNCTGPMVMNQFMACLQCGFKLSPKQASILTQQAEQSSKQFTRNLWKMHARKGLVRKLITWVGTKLGGDKPAKQSSHITSELALKAPEILTLKRSRINSKRIVKLENSFNLYSSVVYGGNYHLLEMCAFLLKVYHESGQDARGLRLVDCLNQCLGVIYPELTDQSLIKLLYILNYCSYFYADLLSKQKEKDYILQLMIVAFPEIDTDTLDPVAMRTTLWQLVDRLSTKLANILQYDMSYRGQFFPVLHQRFAAAQQADLAAMENLDQEVDDDFDAGQDELYFRRMYLGSQLRLAAVEQMCLK